MTVQWKTPSSVPFMRETRIKIGNPYSKEELQVIAQGIKRELKSCPEDKIPKLLKVLNELQGV